MRPASLDRGAEPRPELRGIKLLLPVWGPRHLDQFLTASLPSLLWPGNLPALAEALPCEFVVMTGDGDADALASHPNWHRLMRICPARIVAIDDLISDASYAVTVTLAYARAVRATGPAMLDTGFIFLVSDFLVADGSLAAVLARLRGGADGVLAGNFLVAAEAVGQSWPNGSLAETAPLTPRQLVRWSLDHFHTETMHAMVNAGYRRVDSANRLFWQVDHDTLLGCFYLMHMIGIRPEVTEFTIGSSCDYSFIPELCPSNRVAVLTDSDEYFATEMQSVMNTGVTGGKASSPDPRLIAHDLSRWTTARHRQNARHLVLFHAADIPERLSAIRREADALIDGIGRHLSAVPQPHRGHPSWIGGIALHGATTGVRELEFGRSGGAAGTRLWWWVRMAGFGHPPDIRPWHPRWPDFAAVRAKLGRGGVILILSDQPRSFRRWAAQFAAQAVSVPRAALDSTALPRQIGEVGLFDRCLLVLPDDCANGIGRSVDAIGPLLKPRGEIIVAVINHLRDGPGVLDPAGAAAIERGLAATGWTMHSFHRSAGAVRRGLQRAIAASAGATRHESRPVALIAFLVCAILAPLIWVGNEIALRSAPDEARRPSSSALFVLRPRPKATPCVSGEEV
jgi:hypothetical protein